MPTLEGAAPLPGILKRHMNWRVRAILLARNAIPDALCRVLLQPLPPVPFLNRLHQLISPKMPQLLVEILKYTFPGGDGWHVDPIHCKLFGLDKDLKFLAMCPADLSQPSHAICILSAWRFLPEEE